MTYAEFIADPLRRNVYAVSLLARNRELGAINDGAPSSYTLRFATDKLDTEADPPIRYWPRLKDAPSRYSTIRTPVGTTSFVEAPRTGEIIIGQRFGDLDNGDAPCISIAGAASIRDMYFGGSVATVYHGGQKSDGTTLPFSQYRVVHRGKTQDALVARDEVRIPIEDSFSNFDYPLQDRVFIGNRFALYSSGTSQYVTVAASAYYNYSDSPWTWGFRMWIESLPGADVPIICRGAASVDGYRIILRTTGAIRVESNQSGATQTVDSTTTLSAGQWYHVAVTYNGAGSARIYFDGESAGSGTVTDPALNAARAIYFLRDDASGVANPNVFLQEIWAWNNLFVAEEIDEMSQRVLIDSEIANSELKGYWKCDDGTGTTLVNYATSGGVNGSITGATFYTSLSGTEDLAGNPLPDVFGFVEGYEPVLIDASRRIYQVHSGLVNAIINTASSNDAVYEGASALKRNAAVFTSYAAFVAATTPPTMFDVLNTVGGCWIRLGSPPQKPITMDVQGDKYGGTYRTTAATLIRLLITTRGNAPLLDPAELVTSSFTALDTDNSAVLGFATTQETTVLAVINFLANTVGAVMWFTRASADADGAKFKIERFEGVNGKTPTVTLTERDISLDSSDITFPTDPPMQKLSFTYRRIYRKHAVGDLAAGTYNSSTSTIRERAHRYLSEWRKFTTWPRSRAAYYPDAQTVVIESAFTTKSAAEAETKRRFAIHEHASTAMQVTVRDRLRGLDIMDAVYVHYQDFAADGSKQSRFGTSATYKMLVLGVEELENNEVRLTLWREGGI